MTMHQCLAIVASLLVCFSGRVSNAADKQLTIFPPEIQLSKIESRQTIVAQWQIAEELDGQAVQGVSFSASDENVVRIEDGQAIPVANGKATITAKVGNSTAIAEV